MTANGIPINDARIAVFLGAASATDNIDGVIAVSHNAPAIFPIGSTRVIFSAIDAAGNQGSSSATVTVTDGSVAIDFVAPIISLKGNNNIQAVQGQQYVDAGATAVDNVDGDITANIITNNTVNTSVAGNYAVTYDVTDSAGNAAIQVTRTVNVVTNQAPVTQLLGASSISIVQGSQYTDQGATAIDDVDGDISSMIITSNQVNSSVVATYMVTYEITDSAGNTAVQMVRTVSVIPAGGAANRGDSVQLALSGNAGIVEIFSPGEVISNFFLSTAVSSPPAGISTPFGLISYSTTVPNGASSQIISISFNSALPAGFEIYKVDQAGAYSLVPNGAGTDQWSQVDAYTIAVTLTDGGAFDLDGLVNGVIIDPITLGLPVDFAPASNASTKAKGGGCSISAQNGVDPIMVLLLLFSLLFTIRQRINSLI